MPAIERGIEAIIQQAIRQGAFDNLPGKGKPLSLKENPFVNREWQLAFNMLEQRGFALPWMDKRREIESTLQAARETLARTWTWRCDAISAGEPNTFTDEEWGKAKQRFSETIDKLNKLISNYNLEVPADVFSREKIDLDTEIHSIKTDEEGPLA